MFSHLCLALIWAGWARWWLFLPVMAVLAVFALRLPDRRWLLLTPYAGLYLAHVFSPERQPDALTYHLHAVAEWLRAGGMVQRAGFFDVIPHGLETLFTAAASLGGFTAAKFVHFAFLCATLPLMAAVADELGSFDGWPAAALYFTAPVVGVAAVSAYNDAAVAFYVLLTFYLLQRGHSGWAGLAAGFCYAIKMSGGVVPVAVVLWLLLGRRDARAALLAGGAALAMMAPWMIRAWLWAGDPFAPMFPGPKFYAEPLASWHEYVRSYGVPWRERVWEAAVGGARANGLAGPAFLLAPLGLLALRKPGGWTLWLAAAVGALPWLLNAGTRFLMPAMIFIALSLAWVLPRRVAWGVVAAQALLCWPGVIERWTPVGSWHLEGLRPAPVSFPVVDLVERQVKPGERVLDMVEAPRALVRATMMVPWQHAAAWRAADALRAAAQPARHLFYELRGSWPARVLSAIHIEQFSTSQDRWSIQEVTLFDPAGRAVFPAQAWTLSASANEGDVPLVFDRNPVSRWSPWRPRRDGMFIHVEFGQPVSLAGIGLLCRRDEAGPRVRVRGLVERLEPAEAVALNHRAAAMRAVRREGFQWILTSEDDPIVTSPGDWGVQVAGRAGGNALLRISAVSESR